MSTAHGTFGNGGLVDIIGPAAPPPSHWLEVVSIAAVLVCAIIVALWWYRRRRHPLAQARRRLAHLQLQVRDGALTPRAAADEIARALSMALGRQPLPTTPDHGAMDSTELMARLTRARFARNAPDEHELSWLLEAAHRRLEVTTP